MRIELLRLDVGRKFVQPRFQPRPLFFELDLLGRELLQPDDVALLLQIERGDLVAHARQILRGGERICLRLAQLLLLPAQLFLDLPQRVLPGCAASARCSPSAASEAANALADAVEVPARPSGAVPRPASMSARALVFCVANSRSRSSLK